VARPRNDTGLTHAIDAAFEGATVQGPAAAGPGLVRTDTATQREIEELFENIAAHHTAQLRQFAGELMHAPTSKQWGDICAPSLEVVRRGAADISHERLSKALEEFERALDEARRGAAPRIEGPVRDKLLQRYRALVEIVPKAFDAAGERKRREPIIVHTLLEQVDGVSTLAKHRLYKAGLTTLRAFEKANETDVAATTGLDPQLCARVVRHFAGYHRRRVDDPTSSRLDAERGRLVGLLRQIGDCQIAFRRAELDEDTRGKRSARTRREALLRDVRLALAHLGQLELIDAIARLPVDRKLETVGRWLRERTA
jgi:hypothetical protein